jgi:hypothetical protein
MSNIPNTQLTPLEEVIDRVNNAVEITTREFEYLTSWLLHQGEHRRKERHGFSQIRSGDSHQNLATEGRQTQVRGKWEACSRNPSWEEVQKRQSNGEQRYERYYPTNRPNSTSLSSSCRSWSTHLESHEAECCRQGQKGKSKEVTPSSTKRKTTPLCANQVTNPRFSNNSEFPPIKSYDGIGDPANHIENFQTHPSFYNLPDEVACQVFPLTLKGEAREWFNGLNLFTSFSTIKHQFLNQFSIIPIKKQHPTSLFALKQGRAESLTNFVRRFNLKLQIVNKRA